MARHRAFQPVPSKAQQPQRHGESAGLPDDLRRTEVIAARLDMTPKAFRKWADSKGVPRRHVGRSLRWQESVVDAFLRREPWTLDRRSHRAQSRRLTLAASTQSSGESR